MTFHKKQINQEETSMTRKIKRNVLATLVLMSLLVSCLSALFPAFSIQKASADNNPATWIMCDTEDGKMLYNAATTDLVPYSIRSKSNVAQLEPIDGFLNSILSISGFRFKEVNEAILGRPIVDNGKTDSEKEDAEKDENKDEDDKDKVQSNANATAERVNPFDRFGVAGLKWSSYSGEWKYYETDGCADQNEASTTDFGVFYKDRKEPKASFNESSESKDPRVIQYNKGVFTSWGNAFNGLVTNGLFGVAKTIVTFTIALISFSFTDVTDIIGLGSSNGSNGLVGLFTNLYNGFFTPLVTLAFLFTAGYVMYYGLVKRQIRQALISGLAQTFMCLFLAIVIAGNASFWIPLPNRIATYTQAVVINALGQSTTGQNGLCGTNVGAMKKPSVNADGSANEQKAQMQKIGENMRSTVGCRMWEEFLLKPWARGQFGSEYSDLTVAGTKNGKLKNINSEWTKKADVPLGGNVIEHNLALFQLSAQTEAHAQLSPETGLATDSNDNQIRLVDGISSDWWRVADILSNYDEEKVTTTPPGSTTSVETEERVNSSPLPQWQSWIGNKPTERYSTAFLSIIFGGLGSVGPLVFGLLTTIYSVGVTLLMALSPIFLLLGCWAGRGQQAFRGWLEALVSTMIKKVVATGLLLISFAFTINAMNMINTIGWIKAFLLLFIMTLVLIKNRKVIMDTFSKVNFGGVLRPDRMFSSFVREKTKYADEAAMVGVSALTGAQQARRQGMSMLDGAMMGAGVQMKNTMRKNTFGRAALTQMGAKSNETKFCSMCSRRIDPGQSGITYHYYINDEGDYICSECAVDMGQETELYKIEGVTSDSKYDKKTRKTLREITKQRAVTRGLTEAEQKELVKNQGVSTRNAAHQATANSSWLSYTTAQKLMNLSLDDEGNLYWDNDAVVSMISDNMSRLNNDFDEYEKEWRKYGEATNPPAVPEPISKYVSSAYLDEAWHSGYYNIVEEEYTEAWKNWYIDNSISITNLDDTDREATIDYISSIPSSNIATGVNDSEHKFTKLDNNEIHELKVAETLTRETLIKNFPPTANSLTKDEILDTVKISDDGSKEWDNKQVLSKITDNLEILEKSIASEEIKNDNSIDKSPFAIPEPLDGYINPKELDSAWKMKEFDEIQKSYATAWSKWYDESSVEMKNVTENERDVTVKNISRMGTRKFTKESVIEKLDDKTDPINQNSKEINPIKKKPFRKGAIDEELNRKANNSNTPLSDEERKEQFRRKFRKNDE